MMLRQMILGGLVAGVLVGPAGLANAAVTVNIGIDLPAPPRLVVVAASPVAYAPAVPANYFFYGQRYYVFTDGVWYVSPRYNGPWVALAPAYVPRPLLAVPVRYYHAPPKHWAHWQREAPPHWAPAWGRRWAKHQGPRQATHDEPRRDERRSERGEGHRDHHR